MSARWMRRVLGLAPRAFRQKYTEELVATYAEREPRAASSGNLLRFRLRELWGAVLLVARLRLGLEGETKLDRARSSERSWIATTWQDARFAAHSLLRSPGFALSAIAVLGLGIGATSAIFSAVNAYFFQPLPFADPDRLVTVYETNPEFGWVDQTAAPANLLDWRERVDAFVDVSGYSEFTDDLTAFRDGEPVVVTGTEVLGNFFSTLGVAPALGRTFRFGESWLGEDDVVVLSHALWVRQFGADPNVVGKPFEFATHTSEIVGVMPEGFRFPDDDVELWYPMGWDPASTQAAQFRRAHYVRAFARLAPDVTLEEADADLQVVVRRLQEEYPETNSVMGAGIVSMRGFLVRSVRGPLQVLVGAAALLLLLACANVANLLLARGSERTREMAVRRALGASHGRLATQMLAESFVLAAAGGALGLGIGWLAVRGMGRLTPVGINGATSLSLDQRVVAFTVVAAGACALLFGSVPGLRAGRRSAEAALRERTRRSSEGREQLRAAGTLVSVQLALALLLVAGAALMLRSSWLLARVNPGFRSENVLAVQFAVQSARYPERDQVLAFYDRFATELEARPGVERVGQIGRLPLDGPSWTSQFIAEGWPPERVGNEILHRRADRGYFETLDIPLLSGRLFEPADRPDAPRVLLVNEAFARRYFPDEDPVGRRIAFTQSAGPDTRWWEIIGVVGDQQQESLARAARPEVFESRDQDWGRNNWFVIRGSQDPSTLVPVVRDVLHELDPLIPLAGVRPLEALRGASVARERLVLRLLSIFGLTALLLSTVGVYAVTSRVARRRTQEIGIRMVLGAGKASVSRMMIRSGLGFISVGLSVGVAGTLLTTRALQSLLYGVEPNDPVTLGAVVVLLGAVALLASYLPARRAAAASPLESLRAE